MSVRCPPDLPRDVVSRLHAISKMAARALGIRDLGRIDFRVGRGRPPLPAGGQRAAVAGAGRQPVRRRGARGAGLRRDAARDRRERGAPAGAGRQAGRAPPPARRSAAHRLHVQRQARRHRRAGNDAEAEYDAPETIDAIREALEGYGHVTLFEATAELPRQLMQTPVDLVFNIAEGVAGRNREAAVPGALRAARHPVHRLRRGHAVDRARQGAVEARAPAARHPHRGVPGDGDRPRAAVVEAEVPADRQTESGGLVEGGERVGLGRRRRGGPARGRARS